MRYYPVFMDIQGRPCIVVGGGPVAERKVLGLLSAGASIKVISPRATARLKKLHQNGRIRLVKRPYKKGDLAGAALAFSAAGSEDVNRAVYNEARKANIALNTVDDPARCGFIVPSIIDRGGLVIAISTSGKSPALAKKLREVLEKEFGPEYSSFVEILGEIRKKLLKSEVSRVKKERVINALVASPIPRWIKGKRPNEIDAFIEGLLGKDYLLSNLGLKLTRTGIRANTKDRS